MPALSRKTKISLAIKALIPEQFAYVFEYTPVLWCESETDYHRLLADFLSELSPETIIEYHWVKSIVDVQWEIRRYRRLNSAALIAEMPSATRDYMGIDFDRRAEQLGLKGGGEVLMQVIRLATAGNPWCQRTVDKLVEMSGTSYDSLLYKSYAAGGAVMSDISARLYRLEQHRDDLIKKYENRRRSLEAHKRSLIGEESNRNIVEIDEAAGNGEKT